MQRGVVVADLEPGGPAERAGLKRKDIILSLNGNEVDTARRFDADINRRQGGEKLDLLVQRADDRLTIGVEVEEQSAPWEAGIPWTVLAQGMFALPVNISGTQDRSFGWTRTWFDCDRELIENGIPRVFTPALTLHGDDVVGGIPPLADRIGLPEELRLSRRCQSSFLTSAMWIFRECLPPGSAPVPPLRGTSVRGASSSLAHPSEHGEGAVGTVLQARRR